MNLVDENHSVKCNLCGGESFIILTACHDQREQTGYEGLIVQCENCTLVSTHPAPAPQDIGDYYPPSYAPHLARRQKQSAIMDKVRRFVCESHHQGMFSRALGSLYNLTAYRSVPVHMKPGRLLDVGCGSGAYLRDMEALGWQVAGVDISPEAIKCATRDGYNAKVGTLFSAHLEEESFDLITMWHVLEHFHRPVDMLRRAHDILRPNGRLILAVPNWRSIMRQIGGDAWWCLEVPRHLHHFTPETLRKTLTTAGFEVSLLRPKVRPRMVVGTLGMKFPSLNGGSTLKNRILEAAVFPFELAAASGLRSDTIWAVATRK